MAKSTQLTIINSETMRGVIAPAEVMSKELLADLVDFLELASPESMKETKDMLAGASDERKWVSLDEIHVSTFSRSAHYPR